MLRILCILTDFKIDTSTLYKIMKKTHFIWKNDIDLGYEDVLFRPLI